MTIASSTFIVQVSGFGLFLWLGLYLFVRAEHRTPLILISVAGLLAQAAFFAGSALTDAAHTVERLVLLERFFWWSAVVPAATWFHFSSLISTAVPHTATRQTNAGLTPMVLAVYAAATLLILLGTSSNAFLNYAAATSKDQLPFIPPNTTYVLYIAYLSLTAIGACLNFSRALRLHAPQQPGAHPGLARQLRLLLSGGLIFLIGALWIPSRYNWSLHISVIPGYACLLIGAAALGYGIAQLGLMLEGQNIRRDSIYHLTGILLVNSSYVVMLRWAGLDSIPVLLVLVGMVILTHTTFDGGRRLLDKIFFTQAEQTARAEAREYATTLGTNPVATAELISVTDASSPEEPDQAHSTSSSIDDDRALKAFEDVVRKAISGLKNPPQLAKSPLLLLDLVTQRLHAQGLEDNRLNRIAILRQLLIEQIEGLRPLNTLGPKIGDAWRFYNVLYYPYVRELSRKAALVEAHRLSAARRLARQPEAAELEQVLDWLTDIDEDTFYKWQRRASNMIAMILWEENRKLTM